MQNRKTTKKQQFFNLEVATWTFTIHITALLADIRTFVHYHSV